MALRSMPTFTKKLGQSTVELALMMPTLVFLLFLIFKGFSLNDRASQNQVIEHDLKLERFDHGNGSLDLAGGLMSTDDVLDLVSFDPVNDIGDILLGVGASLATDLGLNAAFSNLSFFQKDTFISGAAKGAITESAHQLVNTGVNDFKFESVGWAAATGGLSSGQSTEFFQGADNDAASWREALGSMLQYGAIGFTGSEGDARAIATGAVSGLSGSDTLKATEGKAYEPLVGAAKGALQATVTGALTGTLSGKTVLVSSGLGAFNTKTVAELMPMGNWTGDARHTAMFTASNAALSTWAHGGDAAAIATAGVSSAIGSAQVSKWKTETIKTYKEKAQKEINAAGLGAAASFVSGTKNTTPSAFEQNFSQAIAQAGNVQNITAYMQSSQTAAQAAQDIQNILNSQAVSESVLDSTASVLLLENTPQGEQSQINQNNNETPEGQNGSGE